MPPGQSLQGLGGPLMWSHTPTVTSSFNKTTCWQVQVLLWLLQHQKTFWFNDNETTIYILWCSKHPVKHEMTLSGEWRTGDGISKYAWAEYFVQQTATKMVLTNTTFSMYQNISVVTILFGCKLFNILKFWTYLIYNINYRYNRYVELNTDRAVEK